MSDTVSHLEVDAVKMCKYKLADLCAAWELNDWKAEGIMSLLEK